MQNFHVELGAVLALKSGRLRTSRPPPNPTSPSRTPAVAEQAMSLRHPAGRMVTPSGRPPRPVQRRLCADSHRHRHPPRVRRRRSGAAGVGRVRQAEVRATRHGAFCAVGMLAGCRHELSGGCEPRSPAREIRGALMPQVADIQGIRAGSPASAAREQRVSASTALRRTGAGLAAFRT